MEEAALFRTEGKQGLAVRDVDAAAPAAERGVGVNKKESRNGHKPVDINPPLKPLTGSTPAPQ